MTNSPQHRTFGQEPRQRCVTLIVWSGFPLMENPLVLSHHCSSLMYNRPQGIMLDAAAIKPNSLWNCFTVSSWPSFTCFKTEESKRWEWPNPKLHPEKWSPEKEIKHFSSHSASTKTSWYARGQHLIAEMPSALSELNNQPIVD